MIKRTRPDLKREKSHNPSAAERDERVSLYGASPEDVGRVILTTEVKVEEPVKRTRKSKT
jgi:hypothetical protein